MKRRISDPFAPFRRSALRATAHDVHCAGAWPARPRRARPGGRAVRDRVHRGTSRRQVRGAGNGGRAARRSHRARIRRTRWLGTGWAWRTPASIRRRRRSKPSIGPWRSTPSSPRPPSPAVTCSTARETPGRRGSPGIRPRRWLPDLALARRAREMIDVPRSPDTSGRDWYADTGMGVEYDTNVFLYPNQGDAPIVGGPGGKRYRPSDPIEDTRFVFYVDGGYRLSSDDHWSVNTYQSFQAGVQARSEDVNYVEYQPSLSVTYEADPITFGLQYTFTLLGLGGDTLSVSHEVEPSVTLREGARSYTRLFYRYTHNDYMDNVASNFDLSGNDHRVGVDQYLMLFDREGICAPGDGVPTGSHLRIGVFRKLHDHRRGDPGAHLRRRQPAAGGRAALGGFRQRQRLQQSQHGVLRDGPDFQPHHRAGAHGRSQERNPHHRGRDRVPRLRGSLERLGAVHLRGEPVDASRRTTTIATSFRFSRTTVSDRRCRATQPPMQGEF